jgi:hypothetical protein
MADTSGLIQEHTRRRPSERTVRRLLLGLPAAWIQLLRRIPAQPVTLSLERRTCVIMHTTTLQKSLLASLLVLLSAT